MNRRKSDFLRLVAIVLNLVKNFALHIIGDNSQKHMLYLKVAIELTQLRLVYFVLNRISETTLVFINSVF